MALQSMLRRLPPVGQLLDHNDLADVMALYGRDFVRVQARHELDDLRQEIQRAEPPETNHLERLERRIDDLPRRIARRITQQLEALKPVINATGIFVHTNLGRAPLGPDVVAELVPLLIDYCDLEMDLESGQRAERNRRTRALLRTLCGAPDALVVNNNAAALVLAVATLAKDRQVIVSRGELVEIGGSFRIPEILEAAGARMREVGTTNRTHLADYRRALDGEPALLLKVHPSNYRIQGFTSDCSIAELSALAKEIEVPLLFDEGSGLVASSELPQLRGHISWRQALDQGADLVCGSGDKIFGGPQAGMLLGRSELVERCRRHPLYRALRPGRMVFAALEAVIRRHLADEPLPVERLWRHGDVVRTRLERLGERLQQQQVAAQIVEADAFMGGGAAAEEAFPGVALAIDAGRRLAQELRRGRPAVVGYVRDDRLILDLRTVDPRHDEALGQALEAALGRVQGRLHSSRLQDDGEGAP